MERESVVDLQTAVEHMHGGTATLAQSVPVKETFEGATVWEGVVHVFDLAGHARAARAYAWSSPIEGSAKRRLFAAYREDQFASGGGKGGYRGGAPENMNKWTAEIGTVAIFLAILLGRWLSMHWGGG